MQLVPLRIEATLDDRRGSERRLTANIGDISGTFALGPVEVTVERTDERVSWTVANRGDVACDVRAVSLVFGVEASAPLRMFRHGYQSWSPCGVATFGVDTDPSAQAGVELVQATYHADQRTTRADELRSEWVTVVADAAGDAMLLGFDGGGEHDGTFRLRGSDQAHRDRAELCTEAFLGGARIEPGEQRVLHSVLMARGDAAEASVLLADWARHVGRAHRARVTAPFQIGWCSWYHYFGNITEAALRANLALSTDWPFELFQLDDGYQAAIGDWLLTNDTFPSKLDALAASIDAAGRTPGIWLAPFLVAPGSELFDRRPDWVAAYSGEGGGPLRTWWNPAWGGGDEGFLYGLDTTNPEVLAYLEDLARDLVDAGFQYLKLDFTFSPSADGVWTDRAMTPAQRVRAGFEAIRRGAGDDTFLLGCGAPLAPIVGLVDGVRIGPDVAPTWSIDPASALVPGYAAIEPATKHAYGNTLARSFMHRQLWLNDPDCVMLRTVDTDLTSEQARTWAHTVGVSGGMVLVSDDLALLDGDARAVLDEATELGRKSDADAAAGRPAIVPDLLDEQVPRRLCSATHELVVDPGDATSMLQRRQARRPTSR